MTIFQDQVKKSSYFLLFILVTRFVMTKHLFLVTNFVNAGVLVCEPANLNKLS